LVGVEVEVGDPVDIVAGADVRPEEKPVATLTAGERVVAGTAVESGVAAAANQPVGADAAEYRAATAPARQLAVATVAEDCAGRPAASHEDVIAAAKKYRAGDAPMVADDIPFRGGAGVDVANNGAVIVEGDAAFLHLDRDHATANRGTGRVDDRRR